MKLIMVLILTFPMISKIKSQELSLFEKKEFIKRNDTLRYRIMYPLNFDRTKKYPLIVFLHGSGECGKDNSAQLTHGGEFFAKEVNRLNYPAIVIFPQCPNNSSWVNYEEINNPDNTNIFNFFPFKEPTKPMELTIKLIKQTLKESYVDKKRVYIGGLSLGGMATFEILYRYPKIFAAAIPMCGGGNPESASKYAKKVKLWVFHGAKDDVVLPKYSEKMVEAIKKVGGEVKFTLYPDANHNCWDSAFAEPNLLPWLFSNIKK
jgi:predicted peptidase